MLATTYTRTQGDLKPYLINVEVHQQAGLPGINLIGLPEMTVKESRDRVKSAIIQSGLSMPSRRFTINLAPADLPKTGTHYELAIAIGILQVSSQLIAQTDKFEFYGELALSGQLRATKGLLPALLKGKNKTLIIPKENETDTQGIDNKHILLANHLNEVVQFLRGEIELIKPNNKTISTKYKPNVEWNSIRGQEIARQAMIYAACGGHSLLMLGPPGCGKSLLAQTLPDILPNISNEQAIETALNYSVSRHDHFNLNQHRPPFRQPHHTTSSVALIGGGAYPQPGEISLAHNGILFLDELPEFRRDALEALREPLETGYVRVSRANKKSTFPAKCQLIAAMNPCPCGHLGEKRCQCTEEKIQRYRSKISGPLLDRIDMHVELHAVNVEELTELPTTKTTSAEVLQHVTAIRSIQFQRQAKLNAHISIQELEKQAPLGSKEKSEIQMIITNLKLSARSYHRILRLTRTIADSYQREKISTQDIHQAVSYRVLDRNN